MSLSSCHLFPPQDQAGASTVGDGSAGGAAGDDGGEGAEAWGNEQYEAVTVRGVDKAHYRFLKRIQLYPEQCVRCVPGGAALTDRAHPGGAPLCRGCVCSTDLVFLETFDNEMEVWVQRRAAVPDRKEAARIRLR